MSVLCRELFLTIDPARISLLRFLLEGYDNMGLVTTDDPAVGKVRIRYTPSFEQDLHDFLSSTADTLGLAGYSAS